MTFRSKMSLLGNEKVMKKLGHGRLIPLGDYFGEFDKEKDPPLIIRRLDESEAKSTSLGIKHNNMKAAVFLPPNRVVTAHVDRIIIHDLSNLQPVVEGHIPTFQARGNITLAAFASGEYVVAFIEHQIGAGMFLMNCQTGKIQGNGLIGDATEITIREPDGVIVNKRDRANFYRIRFDQEDCFEYIATWFEDRGELKSVNASPDGTRIAVTCAYSSSLDEPIRYECYQFEIKEDNTLTNKMHFPEYTSHGVQTETLYSHQYLALEYTSSGMLARCVRAKDYHAWTLYYDDGLETCTQLDGVGKGVRLMQDGGVLCDDYQSVRVFEPLSESIYSLEVKAYFQSRFGLMMKSCLGDTLPRPLIGIVEAYSAPDHKEPSLLKHLPLHVPPSLFPVELNLFLMSLQQQHALLKSQAQPSTRHAEIVKEIKSDIGALTHFKRFVSLMQTREQLNEGLESVCQTKLGRAPFLFFQRARRAIASATDREVMEILANIKKPL